MNDGAARGFDTSATAGRRHRRGYARGDNAVDGARGRARSLNNRLLARGYFERGAGRRAAAGSSEAKRGRKRTEVHDHGLLGPVRVLREGV